VGVIGVRVARVGRGRINILVVSMRCMRRRTLLATAGALCSAGCSAFRIETGTETGGSTDAATDTDGTTPASTERPPTETATQGAPDPTTEATDTATATDTETETATETATPSEAEREAARQLDQARSRLSTARSEYVAFAAEADGADSESGGDGESPTLLDVDASVTVTVSDVTNPVSRARRALDDVPEDASADQQATVEALRGVATFFDRGVRCQAKLYDAYQDFVFVVDRFYAENTGGVPDEIASIRSETDRARGYFDTLATETSADDTTAFEGLDEATYTGKVDQFEAELDAFPTIADALSAFRSALETFIDAVDDYESGSYRDPREEFPDAAADFRTAAQTLSALDAPDSVAGTVADLVSAAEAFAPACDDLAAASRAGYTGDSSDREDRFAAAQEHLRSSDVAVENFDTVEELVEE
jgi:hypothetical protein